MENRFSPAALMRNLAMLLVLVALIGVPRPFAGGLDSLKADRLLEESAEFDRIASLYASAAQRIPWRPDLYERAGDAYMNAQAYDLAENMYRLASQRRVLTPGGWLAWGKAFYFLGDLTGAEVTWELGRGQPEASPYLDYYLADVREELGKAAGAIASWRAFLAVVPENGWAHYRLALLLAAQDPDAALPELMQAARLSPELDATVQGLRTLLNTARLSDRPSDRLLVAGQALAALGEWDLALMAFQNAVDLDPQAAQALAWAGEARAQIGLDGTDEIERALEIAPDLAIVQGFYGLSLQRAGRIAEARDAFLRASALEPEDAGWQMALAGAYEQGGDLVSAYGYYLSAVETRPLVASTWRALAEFCLDNEVHLSETGLPAVQRLLELDGENWRSLDLAGEVLFATQDLEQAEMLLKQAIALDPTQPAPALHLGVLYLQTGAADLAYSYLLQAQAFDPNGPYGWQAERLLEEYYP